MRTATSLLFLRRALQQGKQECCRTTIYSIISIRIVVAQGNHHLRRTVQLTVNTQLFEFDMRSLDFLDVGETLVQIRFVDVTSQGMASSYCITNP